jgi:hypothetical protein
MITEIEAVELTLSYLDELDLLGRAVGEAIREAFLMMPAYDRAQLVEWVEAMTPLARAGAAEGADLASAYLAELTGSAATAAQIDLLVPALDGPFLRHWHDLSEGYSWEHSRDAGAGQAEMDGIDSARGGAAQRFQQPGVKILGYQRVVQVGACEWCQVVATKLYKTKESGAFKGHKGCRCVPPIPVTAENRAAVKAINNTRLAALKKSGAVGRASEAAARRRARADGD